MLPKLSYILTTYNNKDFVARAFQSALDQDYEGYLEIIVSDDCSTDGTFEIVQKMAAEYTGPHKVIVTQTPKNGHLAKNTNHAVQFATGDWIIRADDDDLSAPFRCSTIAQAIINNSHATCFIAPLKTVFKKEELNNDNFTYPDIRELKYTSCSLKNLLEMPQAGHRPHKFQYQVWSKKAYSYFPPLLPSSYYIDDLTIYYRCIALGDCVEIRTSPLSLIYWGGNNNSGDKNNSFISYKKVKENALFQARYHKTSLPGYEEIYREIQDFYQKKGSISPDEENYIAFLKKRAEEIRLRSDFWQKGFFSRISALRKIAKFERPSIYLYLHVLPFPVFCLAWLCVRKLIILLKPVLKHIKKSR